ncbi:enoyl-CoA hydratase/isomerase family protein [Sphingomonas colocasiae]|uniref:Enoyl-CoA hydratase/isomerase family protein n=1 Tax=Sphingomonas colocasiae TaxID=1848973 RepID=A0ABS7PKJ6_9SPHN|nr:enoyl-CoA hydratase/isomerase family protein [Sphingomonas colocasiae]MBY8821012.1 enoyl-CoA hydratase/isomerase family protein [Sphingomonas colocasiae]
MTSSEPGVTLDRDDAIAILTLSNPARRNAFTPDMRRSLTAHLVTLAKDDGCRAIILAGEGAHFCSGADLSRIDPDLPPPSANATRENMKEVHGLVRAIAAGPKPVIAAVEGIAAGGGLSIALACDHLVVAENARLITAFGKIGLIGDLGIMWSLQQRISPIAARRMLMVPTEVSGATAVDQGLADELCAPDSALEAARAAARGFAALAPLSVALTKSVYAEGAQSLEQVLQRELDLVPVVNQSDYFKQAIAGFAKRKGA